MKQIVLVCDNINTADIILQLWDELPGTTIEHKIKARDTFIGILGYNEEINFTSTFIKMMSNLNMIKIFDAIEFKEILKVVENIFDISTIEQLVDIIQREEDNSKWG